ncbi:hypothetical protein [Streptomyces sp. SP18CS02]|uniref:hypothetical protein n=1 Tax=Streptomyces sp. SP18CS02 TaxID=3002531 RepID=UPI002E7A6169|nr:hypothetical protein [Streptomyces sp. SP18CS02]MEE1755908.1 hypothetical protein [Streptomyces sp. SP18CS02]
MHGHGHGYAPQQPRDIPASVIVLRVLFAMLPLFTCGLLAWAPMIRLAVLTRRALHWALFAAVTLIEGVCWGVLFTDPTEDLSLPRSNISMMVMLGAALVVTAYYLYAEISHFAARRAPLAPGHYPPGGPAFGYGYPSQATTVPVYSAQQGPPQPVPPQPQVQPQPQPQPQVQPQPQAQPTPPPPPRPAPASRPQARPGAGTDQHPRIDQVRAELDELSDILRGNKGQEGRDR